MLEFKDVTVRHPQSSRTNTLDHVSFRIDSGAFGVLTGPSGAGKSTLLRLILALERPTEGTIYVAGRDLARLRRASLPFLRRNVGAVFQDFKLLPEATALQNVGLALAILGLPPKEVRRRARASLDRLGIEPDLRRPVCSLSGGEQQRVAIARALASDPAVLLADEPTGNLDEALTGELLDVLAAVCDAGTTVLVATHDRSVLERTSWTRQLVLRRGVLIEDLERAGTSRTGDLQAIGEVA